MGELAVLTPKAAKAKDTRLRTIYNTTLEAQNAQRTEQGNACAICGRDFNQFVPFQDHLHVCCPRRLKKFCGKCNRGLLCYLCNKFLVGFVERSCGGDPIQYVTNLLAYLKKWEPALRAKGCYEAKETKATKVRRKQSSVRRRNAVVQRLVELRRKESGGDGVQRRRSGAKPAGSSEADTAGLLN